MTEDTEHYDYKPSLTEKQTIAWDALSKLRNYESQMLGDYNGLGMVVTGAAQN